MTDLANIYVPVELAALAKRVGVSAVNLATAIVEGDFTYLDHDELARLKASCTVSPARKPDSIRLLTSV